MSHQLVSQLSELFPDKKFKELQEALNSCDGDFDLAVDQISDSCQSKLHSLYSMFPTVPSNDIRIVLDENDGNVEKATECILNTLFIAQLRVQEKKKKFVPLESEPAPASKNWSEIELDIDKIVKITNITSKQARSLYFSNDHDPYLTVINAINGYTGTQSAPAAIVIPSGQRVQGATPHAYEEQETPRISLQELSLKYQDIHQMQLLSPRFLKFDKPFVEKCLGLFDGDVDRAWKLLGWLLDNKPKTKGPQWKQIVSSSNNVKPSRSSSTSVSTPPELSGSLRDNKEKQKRTKDPHVTAYYQQEYAKLKRQEVETISRSHSEDENSRVRQAAKSGVLDVHFLPVENALSATKRTLAEWWSEELNLRETNGIKQSHNCSLVDPIKVLTGRGIHSKGGVSRIKVAVRKLLEGTYNYEEESSYFLVYGKRKL